MVDAFRKTWLQQRLAFKCSFSPDRHTEGMVLRAFLIFSSIQKASLWLVDDSFKDSLFCDESVLIAQSG